MKRMIALISILWMTGYAVAQPAAPAAIVETEAARKEHTADRIWVSGTVISENDSQIAAEYPGRMQWVAQPGTQVQADAVLARIDTTDLELQIDAQQGRIARLEAQLDLQQSRLQRFERLATENNAAADQLDEARANLEMTRIDITQAETALKRLSLQQQRSVIRAPFPGVVVARLSNPGQYVSPGTPVVRLVDTEDLLIRAEAPVRVAPFLNAGMPVPVELADEQSLLSLNAVIPVGSERGRMLEVRLTTPDQPLVVGSAVRIGLPNSPTRRLISVPRDALIYRGDRQFVFKVTAEDTAERIEVQAGIGIGERVEIIGEVRDGDELIIRGAERLQPGQAITRRDHS